MKQFINKAFPFLFRNRDDISLENKLTNILMFIGAFICFLGFIINYFNGFSLLLNWMIGIGGIAFSILFYFSSYKNFTKQLETPFQIASILLLAYSWQTTDGINGSTTNFFYIVTFALIYCSSKKNYWITFSFLISISIALVLIQKYLPSLIIPYPDKNTQISDITSGFVLAMFTFGIFTILIKKSFDNERLKSEQRAKELALSEKRFKDIAIISADWIWELDEQGKHSYCSEKVEEILGFSQNEIIGKYFLDEQKSIQLIKIFDDKKPFKDLENWNLTKAGKSICLLTSGVPIFDEHNNFKGYRGVNKDITERKLAEIAKIQSEEALIKTQQITEGIINSITVRVFWKDINLIYLGCNKAFALDAGFTEPSEIVGKNDYQMSWKNQADLYRSDDMEVIESGISKLNIEEPQTTPEGKTITLITNKMPLLNSKSEIYGILGTYIDISERKETEIEIIKAKEHAEQSDKLKSAFLANMSHEIRTPLNSIVGFSKIIAKKSANCVNNSEEMAAIIDFNSNVLIQIIDDIIDLSKIESGVISINKEMVNIDELLINVLSVNELTKARLNRNNLELNYKPNIIKGSVLADKIRLNQILNNLISNALKYTENGKVEFGYEIIDNSTIQFYVKDSGIGIPEVDISLIFTRFYKATNEITSFRGIGLGLPITKQLVEKMDGKIWLESQLNKGTTFYFTLPYIQTEAITSKKLIIKTTSDLKDKTILIADDDDGNFLLAKMLLTECGAIVIRAENGQEAVQICKENNTINLVLMDMKMPIMDGIEATKLIKQFRNDLIIIALSANVFDEAKETALSAGCDFFISKPINEKELLELLQS